MLESLFAAGLILLAATGAVLLLCLALLRLMRPDGKDAYCLSVFVYPDDAEAIAKISYAAQILRLCGADSRCGLQVINCGITDAEWDTLCGVFEKDTFISFAEKFAEK